MTASDDPQNTKETTTILEELIDLIEGCMDALLQHRHRTTQKQRKKQYASSFVSFHFDTLLNSIRKAADSSSVHDDEEDESEDDNADRPLSFSCNESTTTNGDQKRGRTMVREIICYGIGNFHPSSSSTLSDVNNSHSSQKQRKRRQKRYSSSSLVAYYSPPPTIQLACVLLIRRALAYDVNSSLR